MSLWPSRPTLNQLLSGSIFGTVLILLGGAIMLVGNLYGIAIGLLELLSPPPAGPTPAGNSNVLGVVVPVLLFGAAIIALGGQLVGYSR